MILTVSHVSKSFGGVKALKDVSIGVHRGEVLGFAGPNGAGKSTLFGVISGQVRPDSGSVTLNGVELSKSQPHDVCRAGLARTFQQLRPFGNMTVLENVMVGALVHQASPRKARQRAMQHIETVGLELKAAALASTLSTGQRKRLEVARALSTEPQVVLLDEVTAGVDPTGVPLLVDLVLQLKRLGLTVLIIEHRMPVLIAVSDRIVAMDLGEVIAVGDPTAVLSQPKVVERYLGRSFAEQFADGHGDPQIISNRGGMQ